MATIIENKQLSSEYWLLQATLPGKCPRMGQFYMVRGWGGEYPLLARPISVYDADEKSVSLLYQVVGEGTKLLTGLKPGDAITLHGPYGNGFPLIEGKIALVGGGVGVAPLYLAAKTLQSKGCSVDLYLGFRDTAVLEKEFDAVCNTLTVQIGGFVTERVEPSQYNCLFCCGPDPMMRALYHRCEPSGTPLYVSMEKRMACGIGACLVCSCKTAHGNRKVCKDGPIFPAEEVYSHA